MKSFWSIIGILIAPYLYGVTILTQYGYLSYFNIPDSFIEFSIRVNTVYAFNFVKLFWGIISMMTWWLILIVVVGTLVLSAFKRFFKFLVMLLVVISLLSSFNFGYFIAKNQTNFLMPAFGCPSIPSEKTYIIPDLYDGKTILVPIDEHRKMTGSFLVKQATDLQCELGRKEIGKIEK